MSEPTKKYELVDQPVRSVGDHESVPAYAVNEFFSAHPSLGIPGWSVTHRATGASIRHGLSRVDAFDLCEVAVSTAIGPDIGSSDPHEASASISKEAVFAYEAIFDSEEAW